ncbi:SMC-Scp complex subunit ScpB [bacterium]|nr:SMC-Scp complex subunit ScpB [candidate division CSSED10-310 bacterium]
MSDSLFFSLCEALLFSSSEPISETVILRIASEYLQDDEVGPLSEFIEWYNQRQSGLKIVKLAGGWQIVTRPEFSDAVRRLKTTTRKARFSRASLETLAIVAYRQPITAPEIENIRGVECSGVLKSLLDKKLITILGRKHGPGNPLLYGTTPQFLMVFGLDELQSLPSLEEFERDLADSDTKYLEIPFPQTDDISSTSNLESVDEK